MTEETQTTEDAEQAGDPLIDLSPADLALIHLALEIAPALMAEFKVVINQNPLLTSGFHRDCEKLRERLSSVVPRIIVPEQ